MIRKWIKEIIKEALVEWESEVSYLGRPGYKWNGNIANFAIYNKILTPAEIKELYYMQKSRFED